MMTNRHTPKKRQRILAVSSGGGHWVELMRLRPAFDGHDLAYVTVRSSYRCHIDDERYYVVNDATRWNKWSIALCALRLLWIFLRERPQVVVSTGAAPGYLALRIAKLFRRRTVWIDSIANVDELCGSGKAIGPWADLWLTQWAHLARPGGPSYSGAVL